jgi:hypothetical protein
MGDGVYEPVFTAVRSVRSLSQVADLGRILGAFDRLLCAYSLIISVRDLSQLVFAYRSLVRVVCRPPRDRWIKVGFEHQERPAKPQQPLHSFTGWHYGTHEP